MTVVNASNERLKNCLEPADSFEQVFCTSARMVGSFLSFGAFKTMRGGVRRVPSVAVGATGYLSWCSESGVLVTRYGFSREVKGILVGEAVHKFDGSADVMDVAVDVSCGGNKFDISFGRINEKGLYYPDSQQIEAAAVSVLADRHLNGIFTSKIKSLEEFGAISLGRIIGSSDARRSATIGSNV